MQTESYFWLQLGEWDGIKATPIEAFLRTVIATSDDLIFVRNRAGRHALLDAAAARLVGCPPDAAVGKKISSSFAMVCDILVSEDSERLQPALLPTGWLQRRDRRDPPMDVS